MVDITYLDFDLLVDRADGGYRARVLGSPAGQANAAFALPFSDQELTQFLANLAGDRLPPSLAPSGLLDPAAFGGRLFAAVFQEGVGQAWQRSLDLAEQRDAGLRLRLRLNDVPELAGLPWEYLHDSVRGRFLALSDRTPVVRYLELPMPERPLAVALPLRVLAMMAQPADYPHFDADREWANLQGALADLAAAGSVAVERLERATLPELQRRLRRGQHHVFHFIGHGAFDSNTQEGRLVLEDEQGQGHLVLARVLAMLLRDHRSLRLAVLNACEGAHAGRDNPFAGSAQHLVQQGVPAVIAMQVRVTVAAAATFCREFYAAVADGYPVDAALAEARKSIYYGGHELEWGTPALYSHAPDGRIFELAQEEAAAQPASGREGDPAAGGVNIQIATQGGTVSGSTISFGDVAGGDLRKEGRERG